MRKLIKILIPIIILVILPSFKIDALESNERGSITICIDPGHQEKADKKGERMSPNSSSVKPRVSQGTIGSGTKTPEYVVNLEASMILKDLLIKEGYNVVMTRECHDVNISNAERAQFSNKHNAAMTIRIHCDSLKNRAKTGATILVPCSKADETKGIFEESNRYAELLKKALKKSNIKVNGIFERRDITGFNWSKVPVVILEMGFMSNYNEDQMLNSKEYQTKLMEAVKEAINQYVDSINN